MSIIEQVTTLVSNTLHLNGSSSWQERAAEKKRQQIALIPDHLQLKAPVSDVVLDVTTFDYSPYLSPREIEITEVGSVELLLENIKTRKWTALEVAKAFSNRALVAHQLTNCLTEIFVEQGLEQAKALDRYLEEKGETVGPLHGLPISLKDQIDVQGVEMTMGYVGWIGNVSERNAVLVDILLQQGAVIYCRTNVPQALMFSESVNNLWGRTTNPFNRKLTCGGSSGGEGSLIGLRGSIMGVGSDLGGSVRIPAAFQGLYGLRPSYNRVPYMHSTNSMEGQEAVPSVLGPMTVSVDGLKIFMKAVADAKPWNRDPIALRLPWNENAYALADHGNGNKLCFGMMWDDGVCRPQAPYTRAMEMTKKALEAAGHTVIDWKAEDHAEGSKIIHAIYNADAGHDIQSVLKLSGEPLLGWVMNREAKHLDTYSYWQLCRAKLAFIKKQLDRWEATKAFTGTGRPVDAIICPVSANCSAEHDVPQYINYTSFANLTDWTASNFPVLQVDPAIDVKPSPPASFYNEEDKRVFDLYDPDTHKNAPIGLQLIGRKNEEEAVIKMTEIVAAALAKHKKL